MRALYTLISIHELSCRRMNPVINAARRRVFHTVRRRRYCPDDSVTCLLDDHHRRGRLQSAPQLQVLILSMLRPEILVFLPH